jgi:hypothetical protein
MALVNGSAKPMALRPSATAAPGTLFRIKANSSWRVIAV